MDFIARRLILLPVFVVILLAAGSAQGQTTDHVKISFTDRIRIETTDNASYLDYDSLGGSSYMRNRSNLMGQWYPVHGWELALRMTNEFRYYFVPEVKQFTIDEVVFDQLYVRKDSAFGKPMTAILGRQNLNFGEGFIIAEGGPLDGSRTAYFNAVNLRWNFVPDHSLSLIYFYEPRRDNLLPIIHDQKRLMVEQQEQGVIAYYARKGVKLSPQAYTIYKHLVPYALRPEADIFCIGGRLQAALSGSLTLTTELATQLGTWGTENHSAVGGYSYIEAKTGWSLYYPQSFTIGGLYLSGDNLTTGKHEGWEPMFGRYPKWSESYAITLAREYGNSYWTNLASIFARTSVKLGEDLTLSLDYHHLMAPHHTDTSAVFPGGKGRDRGDLFIGKLAYKANAHLTGHVLWETLEPGDYYREGSNHASWMRMEMLLTY